MGNECCKGTHILGATDRNYKITAKGRTEIPYGYVLVYPGVLTTNENFSSPMLSIHTYYLESEKEEFDYLEAQFSNKERYRGIGPQGALKKEHFATNETVVMVPIEDIIDIHYTTSIKKSSEMINTAQDVPIVGSNGGCFCCCPKRPQAVNLNVMQERRLAQRTVTIHIQYSKYSYVDTLSNSRTLPEADRVQIYKDLFQPNVELKFYLTNNDILDPTDFDQKRILAENLCRLVMQLKAKNGGKRIPPKIILNKDNEVSHRDRAEDTHITYPNSQELMTMVDHTRIIVIGDVLREPTALTQASLPLELPIPSSIRRNPPQIMKPIKTDSTF